MVARTHRSAGNGANDPASPATALAMWSEVPRRQMALLSQSAACIYRGSQAMRQMQQEAAQRALAHQQEVTQRLLGPMGPGDMLQLQSELLRFHFQEGMQYWQQFAATVMRTQQEMVTGAAEVMDGGAEPTLDTLQRVFEATLDKTAGATGTAAH